MSIAVEVYDPSDRERWNTLVERSPHGTPFHRYGALEVFADASNADLYPLVGYKGEEPVGMLPVFGVHKGPMTAAFSPPPDLKVSYLGPALLNFSKLKRRKAERRHVRFVESCVDVIDSELGPKYTHVRAGPWYDDPRPFVWNDFEAEQAYTYVVDLSVGSDDLFQQFSGDARQNIRDGTDDVDAGIRVGGTEAVREIISQVEARHDEQGKPYLLTSETVVALYETLGDDVVRPYVCTVDGEFAGGIVTLEGDATIYRWQGGAKPDRDVPVNDRLDWHIMQDAIERGLEYYDLVGANNRRLCGYKAKFAPDLQPYYTVQAGTRSMNLISGLYKQLR